MLHFIDLIKAIILGIVEGLTEFLPVSSTGHLILADYLIHFRQDEITPKVASVFEVIIQLGSILAVVVYFWKRLWKTVDIRKGIRRDQLNIIHVLIAIIPAGLLGVLFQDKIQSLLFGPKTVVFALIAGGIFMIAAEMYHKKVATTSGSQLDTLSYKQALAIGLFQCLSLFPGFSRSGSTIAGGLFAGVSHRVSAEFSFIIAVPIMFAATGLNLVKNYHIITGSLLPVFIAGFVTAFIVAMLAIVFFLKLVSKVKLTPFAIYRIIIAIIMIFVIS